MQPTAAFATYKQNLMMVVNDESLGEVVIDEIAEMILAVLG